jgi:hypothetical protein
MQTAARSNSALTSLDDPAGAGARFAIAKRVDNYHFSEMMPAQSVQAQSVQGHRTPALLARLFGVFEYGSLH